MKDKRCWLAEQLETPIADLRPPMTLRQIELKDQHYYVYLDGPSTGRADFDRDLIADMTDSEKPRPETTARFRAAVKIEIDKLQRELNAHV